MLDQRGELLSEEETLVRAGLLGGVERAVEAHQVFEPLLGQDGVKAHILAVADVNHGAKSCGHHPGKVCSDHHRLRRGLRDHFGVTRCEHLDLSVHRGRLGVLLLEASLSTSVLSCVCTACFLAIVSIKSRSGQFAQILIIIILLDQDTLWHDRTRFLVSDVNFWRASSS